MHIPHRRIQRALDWRRPAIVVFILLTLSVPALAAEGTPVSYKSGNDTVSAVLYQPSGKGPFPALVVVHEWWGLVDWVKQQAAKLADQGYVALAIDLYRGKTATTPDEAHELMRGLPSDRASRDLQSAFNYLAAQNTVDPKRIGSIGWCMGGGYAFDLAVLEPRLRAAVVNYGHLASDTSTMQRINAALLGIFGAQDRGIPADGVRQFERQMHGLGKKVEIVIYPDAGHAFENPANKAGYRPQDAADAWRRTIEFLDRNLKK
jgi:carboxymethylenebutenolidase